MVKIRLRRMGAKKAPFYRVVVADSRYPRDGRFIEEIGYYNPCVSPAEREDPGLLNSSRRKRIAAGCGQDVSDVNKLIKQYELMLQLTHAMSKGRMPKNLSDIAGFGKKKGISKMHGFGRKKRLK